MPSNTINNRKTTEFAQLFDFFERLASHRARNASHTQDLQGVPIPPELKPVIINLTTIGVHRAQDPTRHKGRPRRSTVASTTLLSSLSSNTEAESSDDEVSLAKFPLGKQYPFTFRLMLHKLYALDDWKKKVQQVLEKSQMEYKPLAEKMEEEDKGMQMGEEQLRDGSLRFTIGAGGKRATVTAGRGVRQRSQSVAGIGITGKKEATEQFADAQEGIRILKKRCVGRRKSMNALKMEPGRIGGGWVYDAAISRQEGRPMVSFEPTGVEPYVQNTRSRYQSLGGGRKIHGGMKRRLSAGASSYSVCFPTPGAGNKTERIVARKRALTIANLMNSREA